MPPAAHTHLLQQEARHGGLQELGHTLCGGVGAVGCAESVVDIQVCICGQLLGKLGIVLLLLLVEAHVLQQQQLQTDTQRSQDSRTPQAGKGRGMSVQECG
jgi:hypothetical protein